MKPILLAILQSLSMFCSAQELLLNGGFEDENICTEYTVNCAPEAWISSTRGYNNYFKEESRAFSGYHCVALEAGHSKRPYNRSFIRSQLLCGLRPGKSYRLKFVIKTPHPELLDSVGVYFSPIDPLLERKPIHLLAPSLFLSPSNHFLKDTNWQAAELDYVANGTESFLCVAYFGRNDLLRPTGIELINQFYIYLDNFSLRPKDLSEQLCDEWKQARDEIYDMDARHEFLDRYIKHQQTSKPLPLKLPSLKISKQANLMLPELLFATAMKDLAPLGLELLDSFCRSLAGKTLDSLVIEGHTDNVGSAVLNDRLAADRAQSVASYLQFCAHLQRVPRRVYGMGSRDPLVPNNSAPNRQKNRRVELTVYFRE